MKTTRPVAALVLAALCVAGSAMADGGWYKPSPKPEMPAIEKPEIIIPDIKPEIEIPAISVPEIEVPKIDIEIEKPDFSIDIEVPEFVMPEIEVPGTFRPLPSFTCSPSGAIVAAAGFLGPSQSPPHHAPALLV